MGTAVGAVACPVSTLRISATAARINGIIVTALLAVALLTPAHWVLAILVVDFAVKIFAGFRVSPICALSRTLAGALGLPTKPVDQAPKRFAADLGLLFSTMGVLLGVVFDFPIAYALVVGMFAVCAALEGFAGFCLGCVVYTMLPEWARRQPPGRYDRG